MAHPARLWSLVLLSALVIPPARSAPYTPPGRLGPAPAPQAEAPQADEAALHALAEELSAARTERERGELLIERRALVSVGLRRALVAQGDRHRAQKKFEQALLSYRLAQRVAEQIDDREGVAAAQNGSGLVYRLQGDYPQAVESFRRSLALRESLRDSAGAAAVLNNLGVLHFQRNDYEAALEFYGKCLALRERLGDKAGMAGVLYNIAYARWRQGDYTRALETYRRSLALSEELGRRADVAETLNSMGVIHRQQGDYARALESYRKGLALYEALDDRSGTAMVVNNVGLVYQSQGDYSRALESFLKSLSVREAQGDTANVAIALRNVGLIHQLQGNYAQALEYYGKSLSLNEKSGDSTVVATLNNIGEVHALRGEYGRALGYFRRSLELSEALGNKGGVAAALGSLGDAHRLTGAFAQAMEYYGRAMTLLEALGDKQGLSQTLNNIGRVYQRRGEHPQALEFAGRAAALARQIGNSERLWDALLTVGGSQRALGRAAEARRTFAEAIEVAESVRLQVAGGEEDRQRFFENRIEPYHAMIELLVAQNLNEEALLYAERAKARVLLDVLRAGKANVTGAMTAREQEQERSLYGNLVTLNARIYHESLKREPDPGRQAELAARQQKARLEYAAFQTSLYAAHPELKLARGETQPVAAGQAGALLPDAKSALLEYVLTEEKSYLFVLTKDADDGRAKVSLNVYPLDVAGGELRDRAERFRRRLSQRNYDYGEFARGLYDSLLRPAQAQLRGKTTLVIVPDQALWGLPFQALQNAENRFLLEEHAISYAPSLTALREMTGRRERKSGRGPATLLAFGNPTLGGGTALMGRGLRPLPEAERQVMELARLYGPDRARVYVGAQARETRAKAEAGRHQVLHFATHGILNDASPMYSYVVLAQEAGERAEDGLLEAWEVMRLDLEAELVVLSACETARGRVGAGEGVIGLSWAFFVAGCPRTVVSQWEVEAASTTDLMVEFHRRLRAEARGRGGVPGTSEALRQAALKLQREGKYRHPFYWAGFVIVGDGR